jgi:hypothetical protein
MNLKQARNRNKLPQFIAEKAKQLPTVNKSRFNRVMKSMILQTAKPVRGTSRLVDGRS